MRKLNAHVVGIDQGDAVLFSDFEHGGEMWSGEGPRSIRHQIVFQQAFVSAPAINVSLSMWDISHLTNGRMDVQSEDISNTGFSIVFRTWSDTRIARVRVAWIAIGEAHSDDMWKL